MLLLGILPCLSTSAQLPDFFAPLPEGGLLVLVLGGLGVVLASRAMRLHAIGAAVLRLLLLWLALPTVARGTAYMTLDLQPYYGRLWTEAEFGGQKPSALDQVPSGYDYVLVLLPEYARLPTGLPLRCAASGQLFDLHKVTPDAPASSGDWPPATILMRAPKMFAGRRRD